MTARAKRDQGGLGGHPPGTVEFLPKSRSASTFSCGGILRPERSVTREVWRATPQERSFSFLKLDLRALLAVEAYDGPSETRPGASGHPSCLDLTLIKAQHFEFVVPEICWFASYYIIRLQILRSVLQISTELYLVCSQISL
jgi:hypothetical protein